MNYKQDLNFCLDLIDARDEAIGWPAFDWRAKFYTSTAKRSVTAMCVGGVAVNCFNDGDRIHIAIDKHGLAPGVLQCEFTALIPDSAHPDGSQDVVRVAPLDIVLTVDGTDLPADISATLMLPAYVRDLEKNLDEIRKAIGCSLDEINARLEAILGREPGTPDCGGSGGETVVRVQRPVNTELTRGVIPLDAEQGRVYRNVGYIKVPVREFERTFDLENMRELDIYSVNYGVIKAADRPVQCVDGVYKVSCENAGLEPGNVGSFSCRIWYNPKAQYIYRTEGGYFVETNAPVFETPLIPPVVVSRDAIALPDISEILNEICKGAKMDVEYRLFKKNQKGSRTKWRKIKYLVQGEGNVFEWINGRERGRSIYVLRVRFSRPKGKKSQWVYFSYASNAGIRTI